MTDRTIVLSAYRDRLGPPRAVMGFFEAHRPLSNFHIENFTWDGAPWQSSEAAFQAAKFGPTAYAEFELLSPEDSKTFGRSRAGLLPDWDSKRVAVMNSILLAKFTQCPIARACLLSTGHAHLEECNWWGDRFWGTVDGQGKNMLGIVLMAVRASIWP